MSKTIKVVPIVKKPVYKRNQVIVYVVVFIALAATLGLQYRMISPSVTILRNADKLYVLAAVCLVLFSFVTATLSYQSLSLKRLVFHRTLLIQVASGFTNRLLPVGLGGVGLNIKYLMVSGHSFAEASGLAAANNLLGIIGNGLLLLLAALVFPQYFNTVQMPELTNALSPVVITLGLLVIILILYLYSNNKFTRFSEFLRGTAVSLRHSLQPSFRSCIALSSNILLSALNVAALSLVGAAIHVHVSVVIALIVLSTGTLLGAAIPTPGGIGGVEVGLVAGLSAFHVSLPAALATAVLYRFLTYGLPIIPGFIAFMYIRRLYV